ncbi:ATP-binding cassette domain-containing protein [Catenuloplanes sp. NPDC051500]|uniref:ATP-binding cassette domain-containing protein n=1 Tax=Catenuloplanes sp. NPDC051500 TaxID=3363959 RepID=UPI0037B20A73
MTALLTVTGLTVRGGRDLVRDVSFEVAPGARVGLIGESGSGKSLTALAVTGLLPPGLTASGSAVLDPAAVPSSEVISEGRPAGAAARSLAAADPVGVAAADPAGVTAADLMGVAAADPMGVTAADPAGVTAADPMGVTAADPMGVTAAHHIGHTAAGPVDRAGARGRARGALTAIDMITASERQRITVRGGIAAVVFQEPLTALDPLMRVGKQIAEPLRRFRKLRGAALDAAVTTALAEVKLPADAAASFPHQLSGGQRQRVAIAMALACRPRLLIADEPTTALDVTVQAEILDLLDGLVRARGMALLFITHDLPVAARIADHLLVLRDGRVVESGPAAAVIASPAHEYTRTLVAGARRFDAALDLAPGSAEDAPPHTTDTPLPANDAPPHATGAAKNREEPGGVPAAGEGPDGGTVLPGGDVGSGGGPGGGIRKTEGIPHD